MRGKFVTAIHHHQFCLPSNFLIRIAAYFFELPHITIERNKKKNKTKQTNLCKITEKIICSKCDIYKCLTGFGRFVTKRTKVIFTVRQEPLSKIKEPS